MFALFTLALLALQWTAVLGHMTLASPVPFGDPTTSPLSSDGSNYPCQIVGSASTFYTESSTSANNTMAIGATQTLSFHGSAVHGGGSCQLALTTDLQPSASTAWQVILSIEGGCPTTDGTGPSTYDYTIPSSITAGKYVFAWTWISKLSGAPEYYMNCAPVTITGSSSKRDTVSESASADDNNALNTRDSSALPNLFVANLASINSCKSTTSTDVLYPDPGPNVSKPSKMTTNFQAPSGSDCFPLGASNSSSSGGGSSAGSSSSSAVPAAASSSPVPKAASSSSSTSTATTLSTQTTAVASAANSTSTAAASTQSSGGFATVSTPGAATTAATVATAATTAAAASSHMTSATPAASASAATNGTASSPSSGGSGLSGSCSTEGTFNCVGGSEYQQCASGTWTALRPMPAGTTCQVGESTTLWARGAPRGSARLRRVRRM